MGTATRPKVKFLMAVWGERYIAMSAAISVPSFLAAGNLPALAAVTDLEVLIMTAADDVAIFRRTPAFQQLERVCPIGFIPIDDIIITLPPLYGFTLTQAFARGIMSVGRTQTSTYFIFMNADFVLADGSLRSLATKILDGDRCVVAPSFQVKAETVEPPLRQAVDSATHVLAMAPRPMAALALANMHPTSVGKTLTQNQLRCQSLNQLYWEVDPGTMIGHAHLIFMLCIKPERPLSRIVSYCDYAFIPEMVPSGQMTCLEDSDDFLMLELQGSTQAQETLEAGPITREAVLKALTPWTTATHRRTAGFSLVIHAADLPPATAHMRQAAATFVRELHADMPAPIDYVDHQHWMGGLEVWRTLHDRLHGRIPPRPLEPGTAATDMATAAIRKLIPLARRLLALTRRPPVIPIWRLDWRDLHCTRRWLAELARHPAHKVLVVSDRGVLHRLFERHPSVVTSSVTTLLLKPIRPQCNGPFDRANIHLTSDNMWQAPALAMELLPRLSPGGVLEIFVDLTDDQGAPGELAVELAEHTCDLMPSHGVSYRRSIELVKDQEPHGLRQLASEAVSLVLASRRLTGWFGRLLAVPLWFAIISMMTWAARRRAAEPQEPTGRVSSVIRFEVGDTRGALGEPCVARSATGSHDQAARR